MDSIDKIVDDLVRKLKGIMDGANNWNNKDGGKRNKLAADAATNNWNDGRELMLQPNSTIPNKLMELYDHVKYWEDKYNNVWGGHDNGYAGWCHGQAKEFYFAAITQCRRLGMEITKVNTDMVAIFQSLHARPGGDDSYKLEVELKSGYARENSVEAELHTKITAEAKASATYLAASVEATVGAEVSSSIKASSSISNTGERKEVYTINLNLRLPVFVYQTSFSAIMADGTTIKGWGAGYIVSLKPIA